MSGAAIILWQNKMMRRFSESGAVDPDSAQSIASIGVRNSWIFRRMAARGVFQSTTDGRYYMDRLRAADFVRLRRKRILTISAVIVVLFAVVMIFMSQ